MKVTDKLLLFIISTSFLSIGVLVYLFFYPNKFNEINLFGFYNFSVKKVVIVNPIIMQFVYAVTSYCHVIFMTFYSVILSKKVTTHLVFAWAIIWGTIDTIFEIFQLKTVTNETQDNSYLLNIFNKYFENGQFSIMDILFIWLGVISIAIIWQLIQRKTSWG
jgi:hypothetical protein